MYNLSILKNEHKKVSSNSTGLNILRFVEMMLVFIKKILNKEASTISGDGKQSRDFIYIENVVKANLKAYEKDFTDSFWLSQLLVKRKCHLRL